MNRKFYRMQNKGPHNPYLQTQNTSTDPRQTEARALLETARRISEALNNDDDKALGEALNLNCKLWTFFQADISTPENPLPQDLKNNLLSLSLYVDKCTFTYLGSKKPNPDSINTLVNINKNIAAGLLESYKNSQLSGREENTKLPETEI